MFDEYGSRGYIPLAINLWEDMETVVKAYARLYPYPFFRDDGSAWSVYRMNGYIPLNYVIDTAGIVVGSMEGFNEALIRSWIEPYLTGVEEKKVGPFGEFTPIFPNPATRTQRVSFNLSKAGPVTLRVYSISGKLMRTVFNGSLSAGRQIVTWDLTDEQRRFVPNGLYFYEFSSGTTSARIKVLVLR